MYSNMCPPDIFPLKSFFVSYIHVCLHFYQPSLSLSLPLPPSLSPSPSLSLPLPLSPSLPLSVTPNVSRITPFNSSVPIGGSIKLLVHFIGGYPLPTATWYRLLGVTNESVPITDSRASASGQHSLNLTITDSALTDDGLYLLKINNTIGSIELHFNVTILGGYWLYHYYVYMYVCHPP